MQKKERINIMLAPKIISILDNYACRLDTSRSDLIQQILSGYIVDNGLDISFKDEQIAGQLEVI